MWKLFPLLFILVGILTFSCSEGKPSQKTPAPHADNAFHADTLRHFQATAFGIGSSKNDQIAREKSRMDAQVQLAQRIHGQQFTFARENKAIQLESAIKGDLPEYHEVGTYPCGQNRVLTVLKAETSREPLNDGRAMVLRESLQTEDLEKSLDDLYMQFLSKTIELNPNNADTLRGAIYLTDFQLAALDEQPGFEVDVEAYIVLQ